MEAAHDEKPCRAGPDDVKAYAVLFPGQGSQAVGMAADVFARRPDLLGSGADEVLGWSLETVVAEGPEEELTRTDRAQPALYATAYALYEAFAAAVDHPPAAAAGHSLGEYTALAASGAMDYWEGLRLVAARGAAMNAAAQLEPSGMAALLGADRGPAEAIAAGRRDDGGRLYVANINAPGQIVLAGGADDITWLVDNARDLGVRRAIRIKVAGAFHSPFMASAVETLDSALSATEFTEPQFPVYANTSARPMTDPGLNLAEQLVSPVLFAESLVRMADDGVTTFVHVGPGNVTAGLAKRSVSGVEVLTVSQLEDVPAAAASLSVD